MKETAQDLYLNKNCNCAESVIRAANEEYNLNLDEKDFKLIGAFGAGCGCGSLCGAAAAAVAVIGSRNIQTNAHDAEGLAKRTTEIIKAFKLNLGSELCKELKPKYFTKDTKCLEVVNTACDTLKKIEG